MATASAHERPALTQAESSPSTEAPRAFTPDSALEMDPFMRAVIIAMAARMLREAAASPDPVAALADSVERTVAAAVASPESVRLVEALTGQAFKDVPAELRQAIVEFAVSAFAKMRRDMLQGRRAP